MKNIPINMVKGNVMTAIQWYAKKFSKGWLRASKKITVLHQRKFYCLRDFLKLFTNEKESILRYFFNLFSRRSYFYERKIIF